MIWPAEDESLAAGAHEAVAEHTWPAQSEACPPAVHPRTLAKDSTTATAVRSLAAAQAADH